MRGRSWILWTSCLTVLTVGAAEEPATTTPSEDPSGPPAGVIAVVNGEPIYFEDLERRLETSHAGRSVSSGDDYDIGRVIDRLVNDELLAQEARVLEMQDAPELARPVDARRRQLALDRLEDEEIRGRVEVTEAALREAFEVEYATYTFHIVTLDDVEQAEAALAELREGADFEELVRERSIDQYAGRGGKVEKVPRINIPRVLASEIRGLEQGELSEPIRTALGWSIVRVDERADADPESFDDAKGPIESRLRFLQTEQLRFDLGERLKEHFPVTVDAEALDAIGCERLSDGRLRPQIEDPERTIAMIGEHPISAAELGRALTSRWKGVRNLEAALAAKPAVLNRLVREKMMRAEAARRGYGETPQARRILAALEKELLVKQYLSEIVAPKIEISPEEVRAFYDENQERFRKPPRVHVNQITVATEEEARRLADLARQGTDFAWLARRHSIDGFKEKGGDRGWMAPSRGVESAQDQLYEAQPGDVFGPFGESDQFRILKVDVREEQGVLEFEAVSDRIRRAIFAEKYTEYLRDYMLRLREASEIIVYEDVLATMQVSGAQNEENETPGAHDHH